MRQSVALARQDVMTGASGLPTSSAQRFLACQLNTVGASFPEVSESEAWLRESLSLCETTQSVALQQSVMANLANLSGQPGTTVAPAEAVSLRARLNALAVQTGRSSDTDCMVCLERLECGSAEKDATGEGGLPGTDSSVQVLPCWHQFHRGCLTTCARNRSVRVPFARCDRQACCRVLACCF